MENDKEIENYPDNFWDDYEENDEPDYYYCNCCNSTQAELSFGNSCNTCGMFGVMEGENF